jgi:hypothetical protein
MKRSYDPTICIPDRYSRRGENIPRRPPQRAEPNRCIRYPVSARQLILDHLPSFCWQTRAEIVTMIEQINEDIPENLVASVLYQMELIGQVEKRLVMTPRRPGQVIDGANRMSSPYSLYEFKRPDLVNRSRGGASALANQFV